VSKKSKDKSKMLLRIIEELKDDPPKKPKTPKEPKKPEEDDDFEVEDAIPMA